MKIIVDLPDYDPYKGVQLNWEARFKVSVRIEPDGAILLAANKEGLISLARHLLTLADSNLPLGEHIHLDPSNGLEEGSVELIIMKY